MERRTGVGKRIVSPKTLSKSPIFCVFASVAGRRLICCEMLYIVHEHIQRVMCADERLEISGQHPCRSAGLIWLTSFIDESALSLRVPGCLLNAVWCKLAREMENFRMCPAFPASPFRSSVDNQHGTQLMRCSCCPSLRLCLKQMIAIQVNAGCVSNSHGDGFVP